MRLQSQELFSISQKKCIIIIRKAESTSEWKSILETVNKQKERNRIHKKKEEELSGNRRCYLTPLLGWPGVATKLFMAAVGLLQV